MSTSTDISGKLNEDKQIFPVVVVISLANLMHLYIVAYARILNETVNEIELLQMYLRDHLED